MLAHCHLRSYTVGVNGLVLKNNCRNHPLKLSYSARFNIFCFPYFWTIKSIN